MLLGDRLLFLVDLLGGRYRLKLREMPMEMEIFAIQEICRSTWPIAHTQVHVISEQQIEQEYTCTWRSTEFGVF